MTAQEIIEKITEFLGEEPSEFECLERESVDLGLGKCKIVDDQEHTDGEAWRIIHFEDLDIYIRQNGYYDSYESFSKYEDHDYDVVVPFEETIISYKKID